MSDAIELSLDRVERQPMRTFTEQACFHYSMYVIMDRACRISATASKARQRRIIYAMGGWVCRPCPSTKKSARYRG